LVVDDLCVDDLCDVDACVGEVFPFDFLLLVWAGAGFALASLT